MKSRKRENRKSGSVRGGKLTRQDIRILRHVRGNPETGQAESKRDSLSLYLTKSLPPEARAYGELYTAVGLKKEG